MNKTIHELNSLAQAQADDELIIYDVSEGESKKIQVQDLNNPNYSTTEQKTGKIWIDGKPIYRKVVDFGALPNTTQKSVAHNIANLGNIISYSGMSKKPSDGSQIPIPFLVLANFQYCLQIVISDTQVIMRSDIDRSDFTQTYIILEYTKTTD